MNEDRDRIGWYLCLHLLIGAAVVLAVFVTFGA